MDWFFYSFLVCFQQLVVNADFDKHGWDRVGEGELGGHGEGGAGSIKKPNGELCLEILRRNSDSR